MFVISVFNKVSNKGLNIFDEKSYILDKEKKQDVDAIILRSYDLLDMDFDFRIKAIARAGAGYNNVPVDRCSENGIVVFNTPGANANGVKELTLTALLLSSRKIVEGINWANTLSGDVINQVEKGKKQFKGNELKGKTLGVIGLGAIGILVANMGIKLGMKVIGYDPYMSVKNALGLSWDVKYAETIDELTMNSDYITLHIPLIGKTKNFVDDKFLSNVKVGARLINISRGALVDSDALLEAIDKGSISKYVTDFPSEELLNHKDIICIPHLGASTEESEENCAVMAARQLKDFLENGNIKNSVNFPDCSIERKNGVSRITIMNKNIPNMIVSFMSVFSKHGINILDMMNKSKGKIAYNIVDFEGTVDDVFLNELKSINGIINVRYLEGK